VRGDVREMLDAELEPEELYPCHAPRYRHYARRLAAVIPGRPAGIGAGRNAPAFPTSICCRSISMPSSRCRIEPGHAESARWRLRLRGPCLKLLVSRTEPAAMGHDVGAEILRPRPGSSRTGLD